MFRLDDKVAVVTGGGSGIGEAIAVLFARQGSRVAILDMDEAASLRIRDAIHRDGGRAEAWTCDVGEATQVRTVFEAVVGALGGVDILVNNAGIPHVGNLESTSEADLERVHRVNVKGPFLCAQAALPSLLRTGTGVILNLASLAALVGITDRLAYSMSKGAVLSMTRSIAVDYMKRIRCNCICPTRIHTPFVDRFVAANYPGREKEMLQELSEYQPMGRMGTVEEVAHLALYLCSHEARFITGQAFPIDGGVLVA